MRTTCKAALWALAGCLSTIALAREPASSTAAQTGAAVASEASQPALSKKAERAANRSFAKKVHHMLDTTKGLGGTDIAVFANARTGEVILGGFIDRPDQERLATEAASKVPGVKSVSSKIALRPQL